MIFKILSLIKKEIKCKIINNEEIKGVLFSVFDDYIVIKDFNKNKVIINIKSIVYILTKSNDNPEEERIIKLKDQQRKKVG